MFRYVAVTVLCLSSVGSALAQTTAPESAAMAPPVATPSALAYKGVTITPVGFLEGAMFYRSANETADMPSSWNNVPLKGSANAKLSEFRGSARQSRFGLLFQGKLPSFDASGYYEMDFLGGAPTANETQSNSFNPRIRQLWARLETSGGFSLVAGQTWSLIATNKAGIAPRAELLPPTIDAQYTVGFTWARQMTLRVTQKLGSVAWVAVSLENPETSSTGTLNAPATVIGLSNGGGSGFASTNNFSTDLAPDVIAKVAVEPGFGHYELKGMLRFFRDRFDGAAPATPKNSTTEGYGIGAAAYLPIVTGLLEVNAAVLYGKGLGRYGTAGGPDVTVKPDGSLDPIKALQVMGGLDLHPVSALDVYVYGGLETYDRQYVAGTPDIGYGIPSADLSGCSVEVPAAANKCSSANHKIWQVTPGLWYRLHKGPEGTFQVGAQYSYTKREVWTGKNGTADVTPTGTENVVMTSARYYFP
jgi:hypothetical protein